MGRQSFVLVTPRFPPETGGAAQFYRLFSRSLADHQEISRVLVLTNVSSGSPVYESDGSVHVLRVYPSPATVVFSRLPKTLRSKYLRRAVVNGFLFAVGLLVSLLFRPAGVVYHTQSPYLGVQIAGVVSRTTLVATVNDLGTSTLAVRFADTILAGSENAKRRIASLVGDERVVHQPFPVDETEVTDAAAGASGPDASITRPYALYVGDLVAYKGVGELLSWWATGSTGELEELVLAGPDRSDGELSERADSLDGVRTLGRVRHDVALRLIADADVFILPSKHEALPRTVLECVILGTSPVCPPEIPEFETHIPEFTVDSVSPEAIGDCVDRVSDAGAPAYPISEHAVTETRDAILEACP